MKILLAEDDIDFGNILAQYITMNGYEIFLARDGKEALENVEQEKPDLCIFDVMMPEIDGFTLCGKGKEEIT